jgi:hypothetical protein
LWRVLVVSDWVEVAVETDCAVPSESDWMLCVGSVAHYSAAAAELDVSV